MPFFKDKLILVTNDDGCAAPGINTLIHHLSGVANLLVVAPDRERSAVGHGLTFFHPLRVHVIREEENLRFYACDGTPTDCVLIGIYQLTEVVPDLIVSGINRGSNLGDDVTYSGTVSAALEGAIQGIPSMAVSLASYDDPDYTAAASFAAKMAKTLLEKGLPEGVFLNVNVPAVDPDKIQGVEFTKQGRSIYKQQIIKRVDPRERDYFWVTGALPAGEPIEGTDFNAIAGNRISITPLHLSFTKTEFIDEMKTWGVSFNNNPVS
ncbi:MAG: 5'/3'-nucleotidase SurE [Firmicutes bacterium]|nr:5'/3'-nucleotidase SurE [Bacillota bacterium]